MLPFSRASGRLALCALCALPSAGCSSGDGAGGDDGAGGGATLGKAGSAGGAGAGGQAGGGGGGKSGSGGTGGEGAGAKAGSGGAAAGAGFPGGGGTSAGTAGAGGTGTAGSAAGGAGAAGGGGAGGSGTAGIGGAGGSGTAGSGGSAALYCPVPNPGSPVILGSAGAPAMSSGELDLHMTQLFDNPPDMADWPITTTIKVVEFGDDVHVEFSKQDGPDRWPDITPPGWTGPLQYTLGIAEYIDGKWVASAAIEYWYGLAASGGNVGKDYQVACNWYYDGRWGPLEKHQPATGDVIGIFVVAGNLRGVKDGSQSPVKERSNVVLVPMPSASGAKYTF